jgi:hypothetical protein
VFLVAFMDVNRALKQSHFCALERGHEELPGEAGRG